MQRPPSALTAALGATLTLSLALSVAALAPLAAGGGEAEAKPGPSSPLKAKSSPKVTKRQSGPATLKKSGPAKPAKPAARPAKPAKVPKAQAPAPKTLGGIKSPKRTSSAGEASGFGGRPAKGAPAARPAQQGGGSFGAAPSNKSGGGLLAPASGGLQSGPSKTLVTPGAGGDAGPTRRVVGDAPERRVVGDAPERRVVGDAPESRGKGARGPSTTTTTTTSTTTTSSSKSSRKSMKRTKSARASGRVERRGEVYQEESGGGGGYGGGGGGGYAPAPRVPTCRPEGNKVMANLGVGFESTQGVDTTNMAYVLGGGLRSGMLGLAGEVQLNTKDGESEMTGWGGQVRVYIPLGQCLDVYPLAGMSWQQAGLEQFKGTTTAYDLGVGTDLSFLGAFAIGARYTRSFFADELKSVDVRNGTTNSRDTLVFQLSLFF